MKTLAERLAWARNAAKLGKRELQRLAGLSSPSLVGAVESGRQKTISVGTASLLCDALGLQLDWLLRGDGPRPLKRHILETVANTFWDER